MLLVVIGSASSMAMFSLVLFIVYRLRPELFRFKLTVTRLVFLDVEMRNPQPRSGEPEHQPSPQLPPGQ